MELLLRSVSRVEILCLMLSMGADRKAKIDTINVEGDYGSCRSAWSCRLAPLMPLMNAEDVYRSF